MVLILIHNHSKLTSVSHVVQVLLYLPVYRWTRLEFDWGQGQGDR